MIFNPVDTGTASIVRPAREQVQTVTRQCRPSFSSFFFLFSANPVKLAFSPSRASFSLPPHFSADYVLRIHRGAARPMDIVPPAGKSPWELVLERLTPRDCERPTPSVKRSFDRARIISLACPKTRRTSTSERLPSKKSLLFLSEYFVKYIYIPLKYIVCPMYLIKECVPYRQAARISIASFIDEKGIFTRITRSIYDRNNLG